VDVVDGDPTYFEETGTDNDPIVTPTPLIETLLQGVDLGGEMTAQRRVAAAEHVHADSELVGEEGQPCCDGLADGRSPRT